jgi:hypothetical protein
MTCHRVEVLAGAAHKRTRGGCCGALAHRQQTRGSPHTQAPMCWQAGCRAPVFQTAVNRFQGRWRVKREARRLAKSLTKGRASYSLQQPRARHRRTQRWPPLPPDPPGGAHGERQQLTSACRARQGAVSAGGCCPPGRLQRKARGRTPPTGCSCLGACSCQAAGTGCFQGCRVQQALSRPHNGRQKARHQQSLQCDVHRWAGGEQRQEARGQLGCSHKRCNGVHGQQPPQVSSVPGGAAAAVLTAW